MTLLVTIILLILLFPVIAMILTIAYHLVHDTLHGVLKLIALTLCAIHKLWS